jgi:hypothetical protein
MESYNLTSWSHTTGDCISTACERNYLNLVTLIHMILIALRPLQEGQEITGGYSWILMICTGQRSEASCAHAVRSSVGVPSPILPLIRYFSMIRLNESSGSCSKNPGQVSQHEPQLTQLARSIITFTGILLDIWCIIKPIQYR